MPEAKRLYLYTEEFFFLAKVKSLVKFFLGWQFRGPQAVFRSLQRGLTDLNAEVILNSSRSGNLACVLGNYKTLQWALEQKQKGKIKKIAAGPNLAVTALDYNKLLANELIDIIIVPCQWVHDNYSRDLPQIAKKLRIWPAGVTIPPNNYGIRKKKTDFLVYNKIGKQELALKILRHLAGQGLSFTLLDYGKFKQADYFKLLEESKYLIYLSESESQGLAMFEAWARNVPVFAWERGFWEVGRSHQTGLTATPYLTAESGQRFKDFEEFKANLRAFMSANFQPRDYVARQFSDRESAKKYLEIIKELEYG